MLRREVQTCFCYFACGNFAPSVFPWHYVLPDGGTTAQTRHGSSSCTLSAVSDDLARPESLFRWLSEDAQEQEVAGLPQNDMLFTQPENNLQKEPLMT
jgi:hypothetical protein